MSQVEVRPAGGSGGSVHWVLIDGARVGATHTRPVARAGVYWESWPCRITGYAPSRDAAISAVLKRADVEAWRLWRGERVDVPIVWRSDFLYPGMWVVEWEDQERDVLKFPTLAEALAAANAQAVTR